MAMLLQNIAPLILFIFTGWGEKKVGRWQFCHCLWRGGSTRSGWTSLYLGRAPYSCSLSRSLTLLLPHLHDKGSFAGVLDRIGQAEVGSRWWSDRLGHQFLLHYICAVAGSERGTATVPVLQDNDHSSLKTGFLDLGFLYNVRHNLGFLYNLKIQGWWDSVFFSRYFGDFELWSST
jgi:hypothetical protein